MIGFTFLITSFYLNDTALEDLLQGHSDFKRGAAEISQFGNLRNQELHDTSEQNLDEVEMDMTWCNMSRLVMPHDVSVTSLQRHHQRSVQRD